MGIQVPYLVCLNRSARVLTCSRNHCWMTATTTRRCRSGVCRRRENADYRRLGPGGGGFNAAGYDDILARLIVDQPGVHHRCVADAAAAADHISYLTKALAQQPFKAQARSCKQS